MNFDAVSSHIEEKMRQELGHNERLRVGKKQVIILKGITSSSHGGS